MPVLGSASLLMREPEYDGQCSVLWSRSNRDR